MPRTLSSLNSWQKWTVKTRLKNNIVLSWKEITDKLRKEENRMISMTNVINDLVGIKMHILGSGSDAPG